MKENTDDSLSVPRDRAEKFLFDLGGDELPLWAEKTEIRTVYRGTLGTEKDNAAGTGFRQHTIPPVEISLPDTGVYALRTEPDPAAGFDPLTQGFGSLTLRNPGGIPENGRLTLAVRYMLSRTDPFQNPVPLPEHKISYIVREAAVSPDRPSEIRTDLSGAQIPLRATNLYVYLICTGPFGQNGGVTEETVTKTGFRDIGEPTPADIWNVTDRICLFGETVTAGSEEAVGIVDANGNNRPDEYDIFPHILKDVFVRFSPADNPREAERNPDEEYLIPEIEPGAYFRFFILSDYTYRLSCSHRITRIFEEDIYHLHKGTDTVLTQPWTALKNQYIFYDPPYCYDPNPVNAVNEEICLSYRRATGYLGVFRGINYWDMIWIAAKYYPDDDEGGCSLEAYDTDGN